MEIGKNSYLNKFICVFLFCFLFSTNFRTVSVSKLISHHDFRVFKYSLFFFDKILYLEKILSTSVVFFCFAFFFPFCVTERRRSNLKWTTTKRDRGESLNFPCFPVVHSYKDFWYCAKKYLLAPKMRKNCRK